MTKKLTAVFLSLIMLVSSLTANAAVEASDYLANYTLGVLAHGDGLMSISFTVQGVDFMDKVGAQEIIVEEYIGGYWFEYDYFDGEDEGLFAYNYPTKSGDLYFYGVPGRAYRAVMTAYAELDGGYDTREFTCSAEYCT